jgi:hypothetical protein
MDPFGSSRYERFVRVFVTDRIPEGLLVKGLLESAGIAVIDKGMAEGPYRMGPVDLWVPEEDGDEAKDLIREAQDPEKGGSPSASSTGEPFEPS